MNAGFTLPWLLASIPVALTFLILAYRRSAYGTRVIVPTLFLLKHLKGMPTARRKFVPPFRFFFELLLFSLLALAAAGLYMESTRKNIAFVIDNSLSMAAKDFSQTGSKNVLTDALRSADDEMELLSGTTRIRVFETSPRLRALHQGFLDPSIASQNLPLIEPRFAGDNLEGALASLGSDSAIDEVYVFTDRPKIPTELVGKDSLPISFRPLNLGERQRQNIALSRISVAQNTSSNQTFSTEVRAEVSAYTKEDVRVSVRVSGYSASERAWRQLGTKPLSIRRATKAQAVFETPSVSFSAFAAELVDLASNNQSRIDSIAEDNKAFVTSQGGKRSMLLVSDYSAQALGLNSLGTVSFRSIRPSEYDPSALKDEPVIFHRFAPAEVPKASSLFILPPANNPLFPVSPSTRAGEVTRWLPSHPALSYLNLPALELKTLSTLSQVPWMSGIIHSTTGIAALAGERGEHRYVVTGFEILPYEGRRAPLLSIFLLNIIKWISDSSAQSGYLLTYSSIALPNAEASASYIDNPAPNSLAIESSSGQSAALPFVPGVIAVRTDGEDSLYAINYFEPSESNLLEPLGAQIIQHGRRPNQQRAQTDLLRWISLIVAALIGLDLLLLLFRSRREIRV